MLALPSGMVVKGLSSTILKHSEVVVILIINVLVPQGSVSRRSAAPTKLLLP